MTFSPLALIGDVTRLRQALINYLTNAVKFFQRHHLRCRLIDQDDEFVCLRFEVEDTGPGLVAELERLFRTLPNNATTRAPARHRPGPYHHRATGRIDGRQSGGGERTRPWQLFLVHRQAAQGPRGDARPCRA